MKKIIFSIVAIMFALGLQADAFAQAKKSVPAVTDSASVWTKKPKDFNKKAVSTLVADIGAYGIVKNNAAFAVVPITTAGGNAKKPSGGDILVLVPFAALENFNKQYGPKTAKDGGTFGSKMQMKTIAGTFLVHKGEPVLLVGIKAESISEAPAASVVLASQIEAEKGAEKMAPSSRKGFTKKIFYVSEIGKDRAAKAEFNRLMGIYNKGKKKNDKVTPANAQSLLEEGGDPYTVFDEAGKIEWEIRK